MRGLLSTFEIVLVVVLFSGGVLLCLQIGIVLGKRNTESPGKAFGVLSGAVFALMGLLIAFSFSGAATRFEAKRQLIATEVNAIGTAYLRIDLLPPNRQEAMRESFRKYLDARIAFYRKIGDSGAAEAEMARARVLQQDIWSQGVVVCREVGPNPLNSIVMSSLNTMIDISTTREIALQMHPPKVVLFLLAVLPLICSFLAGYDAARERRSFIHMLCFAAVLTITVYIILDFEYPRAGLFIHLDEADQKLVDLRATMNN